jgi:predicted dehydrogenase
MKKPEIGVALIGYRFMGKAHSHAYKDVAFFFPEIKATPEMRVLVGRDKQELQQAADQFGWRDTETDWHKAVQRDDVQLVDISTPSDTHKEIAIAAAQAGKNILCEKPLALNAKDAYEMVQAVKKAGVKGMVGFNYRRVPAIRLAKQLIDEGRLGRIYHFRAVYLQSWIMDPNFPLVWRLKKEVAGTGAHGDLGAHIIDLGRYLVGDFDEVCGMGETFIKERPLPSGGMVGLTAGAQGGQTGQVTVDDAFMFMAKMKNGALGTFEATRFAAGRLNGQRFEINGEKGTIIFELERLNELQFYTNDDPEHIRGFRTISVTEPMHPYMSHWWPAGHIIGYEHTFVHEVYDLINDIVENKEPSPDFEDGLQAQIVLDATEKSAEEKRWIKISEIQQQVEGK